jgi:sugar/nucleoside kinase (ribokinase family)
VTEPAVRVICLGDLMVDVVAVMRAPLAPGSDTRASVSSHGGGSAANVAAWLAAAGTAVAFVGRTGADPLGAGAVRELADGGVHTAVTVDAERPTGTCVVLVSAGGERSMLPDAGANSGLRPEDLPHALFAPGCHLHLSGYPLLDPYAREAALAALDLARARRMSVSVDPSSAAPLATLGPERFLEWTGGADLCLANADEARVLTGLAGPHAAAQALAERYAEVVVKLGVQGALWCRAGAPLVAVPAEPVPVADTTGAGDAFAAGFLTGWLDRARPEAALRSGCRLAALAVAQVGARPRRP